MKVLNEANKNMQETNKDQQHIERCHNPVDDLVDDEHLDDIVTESNETDTEIMNNLQFKATYNNQNTLLDSDVDSDAGSTSHRFGLQTTNTLG